MTKYFKSGLVVFELIEQKGPLALLLTHPLEFYYTRQHGRYTSLGHHKPTWYLFDDRFEPYDGIEATLSETMKGNPEDPKILAEIRTYINRNQSVDLIKPLLPKF